MQVGINSEGHPVLTAGLMLNPDQVAHGSTQSALENLHVWKFTASWATSSTA